MKNILYILSFFVLFSCATANAQKYRTHKVRKADTVESIAKQYNVSPSAILALNPDARGKLRRNSIIIIPKPKKTKDVITTTSKTVESFKRHKVKRKETLYSLSKK